MRVSRHSIWIGLFGLLLALILAFLPSVIWFLEDVFLVTYIMLYDPPDSTFYNFYDDGYDRVTITDYYDVSPKRFVITFAPGAYKPETTLLTLRSAILYGEVTWIGKDRVKLAFVVDKRAKIGRPLDRVGRFHIDYSFVRGYEPPIWPVLIIDKTDRPAQGAAP